MLEIESALIKPMAQLIRLPNCIPFLLPRGRNIGFIAVCRTQVRELKLWETTKRYVPKQMNITIPPYLNSASKSGFITIGSFLPGTRDNDPNI